MRQIRFAPRERHGQFGTGVHFAEQNIRDSVSALAACVPRLQNAAYLIEPRHGYCRARFEHDDGPGIGCGHLRDQCILIVGQGKTRQIKILARPLISENNSYI